MIKLTGVTLLVVGDDDLLCRAKTKTLEKLSPRDIELSSETLQKFPVILYHGSLGEKILRLKKETQ